MAFCLFNIRGSREGIVRSLDDDGLALKVVLEAGLTELSADAGVLEATEGSVGIEDIVAVDVNSTSAEGVRDLNGVVNVLGNESSTKTIVGVVSTLDNLIDVLELKDAHNGSKDLFLSDSHVVINIREDSGLDEPTLVADTAATSDKLSSLLLSNVNIVQNLGELIFVYLGTLISILCEWVTDLALLGSLN